MNKKIVKTVLKIVVAFLLLTIICIKNDIMEVFSNILQISPSIWVLLFILVLLEIHTSVAKWKVLLPSYSFSSLLKVRLMTMAYSMVLPGQLATEGMRAYLLGRDDKKYDLAGTSVIIDKVTGLIALLILGVVGTCFSLDTINYVWAIIFCCGCLVLTVLLFLIGNDKIYNMLYITVKTVQNKVQILSKFCSFIQKIIHCWKEYSSTPAVIIKSVLYGIAFQSCIAMAGTLLCYSLGANASFIDWLWINAVLSLVLLLPVSIGGIGIREGTLIGLLGLLGIHSEQAVTVSFGILASQLAQAVMGIVVILLQSSRKKHKSTVRP